MHMSVQLGTLTAHHRMHAKQCTPWHADHSPSRACGTVYTLTTVCRHDRVIVECHICRSGGTAAPKDSETWFMRHLREGACAPCSGVIACFQHQPVEAGLQGGGAAAVDDTAVECCICRHDVKQADSFVCSKGHHVYCKNCFPESVSQQVRDAVTQCTLPQTQYRSGRIRYKSS